MIRKVERATDRIGMQAWNIDKYNAELRDKAIKPNDAVVL